MEWNVFFYNSVHVETLATHMTWLYLFECIQKYVFKTMNIVKVYCVGLVFLIKKNV